MNFYLFILLSVFTLNAHADDAKCLQSIDQLIDTGRACGGTVFKSNDQKVVAENDRKIQDARSTVTKQCGKIRPSMRKLLNTSLTAGATETANHDEAIKLKYEQKITEAKALVLKDYHLVPPGK